jgi:tetratricopeptide (TPR) repeat protein
MPFAHYANGHVHLARNDLKQARAAAEEAIRLDPSDADNFGLLAAVEINAERPRAALEAAERGLALDPEHVRCTNLRSMALVKLGRREEASATLDAALARDPENAATHANRGWALLHAGSPVPAMEHFREALRIEPDMDWARAGIVEALKARNFIYRWMLAYFLWMSRLSGRARWGVILGLYFGYRFMDSVAENNPDLAPWLRPLLTAYIVFALLTWVADPLFNLMLRLSRFGRLALSRHQIVASNWILLCLVSATVCLAIALLTDSGVAILGAMLCGAMSIPVAGTFARPPGTGRRILTAYTALLFCLAVTLLLPAVVPKLMLLRTWNRLLTVFIIGVVAFALFANAIASMRFRRG